MTKSKPQCKTRVDKLPLTLLETGPFCKKMKGKIFLRDKQAKCVGFYNLRRTAAILTARSGNPFAVQRLLGHTDLKKDRDNMPKDKRIKGI